MKKILFSLTILISAYVFAQTCVTLAPSAPPQAKVLIVQLPGYGGTTGCTITASASGAAGANGTPQQYAIGNAKCATSVAIANQAVANDNGWSDGGAP